MSNDGKTALTIFETANSGEPAFSQAVCELLTPLVGPSRRVIRSTREVRRHCDHRS
jgi:hypothetical protein